MTTSKSPRLVAAVALRAAQNALPLYHHRFSPKKFTQPQLVACLVLKEFFKTDYRGIMAILLDSSDLTKVLELDEVPHYTTLQKAARRLTEKKFLDRLMRGILGIAHDARMVKSTVALSAIDSTGFESHYTSSYFVQRKRSTQVPGFENVHYHRFPKVGIVADCNAHLVLAGVPSWGPGPDLWHWHDAIRETLKHVQLRVLTADAGYDSEAAHAFAREEHGIRTIIRNRVGRPTTKLPTGKYRRLMATRFNKVLYGQRWQVETVNSIIKRRLGSFLRARTHWSQMREIMLRLFTYNVLVVRT